MLKIRCPKCGKSFLWTDEMPIQGRCPFQDCEGHYNVYAEFRRNVAHREDPGKFSSRHCPFCGQKISSRFAVCSGCGRVILWSTSIRKSHFFVAACILLILLSILVRMRFS